MLGNNAILDGASRDEASSASGDSWFVYLLPLYDETAFKVGFSRAPLQRIHSFAHRYFERFDLGRASLLQVSRCARARAVEAAIKKSLSDFRSAAPNWVLDTAGGDTEWFIASEFERAREQLTSVGDRLLEAFAYFQEELKRYGSTFELWAIDQAQQLQNDAIAIGLGHDPRLSSRTLNDWLDAYSHFGIELFVDDPAAFEFVKAGARGSFRR